MKNLFYLLIVSILIVACNKKEEDEVPWTIIANTIPVINSIEVVGNHLELKWSHEKQLNNVKYKIRINENLYTNPSFNFTQNLEFGTRYSGKIIAIYSNEDSTSVDFEFATDKSKILFFSTWAGTLYAFDLYTKNIIWQQDSTNYYNHHLSYDSVIITGTDKIRAFNIYTGKVMWRIQPYNGFKTNFTSALEDNNLFITDNNANTTLSIDISTKEISWQSFYKGSHIVIGDQVYLTNRFTAPELVSLDKLSGNYNWGFELDQNYTSAAAEISSQPVLFENNLYFGDNIGRIYSVNAGSGEKNWSKDMGLFQASNGDPVFYESNLIIPIENKIYSINPITSDVNWVASNSGDIFSSPYIYKNTIVVASAGNGNGFVYALNAESGDLIWEKEIDGQMHSSPIVYEESIYVGSWNKEFYEISISTGEITWKYTANDVISNPAVIVIGPGKEVIYPNTCGMQ